MKPVVISATTRNNTLRWLGACPLLAGADSLAHGIVLGLVSAAAICASALAAAGLHEKIPDSARTAGLLLAAVTTAVILRLACEALDFELALASGALFSLAALHGNVDEQDNDGFPALVLYSALPAALALSITGAVRELAGAELQLPIAGFFIMALLAIAWQAWQGRRS